MIGLVLAAALLLTPAHGASSPAADATEAHTFTNAGGKTIQAHIMGVTGESVSLKRDDGQTFNVVIKTFVDADQTYIWHWALLDAAKKGTPIFKFELSKTAEVPSGKNNKYGTQGYAVKVTNTTSLRVLKPVMQYQIFDNPNINVPGAGLNGYSGMFNPDEIAANGTGSFETLKVTWPGLGGQAIGRLMGLWVRVYDADHQLIQEWSSPPELMKKEKWLFIERGRRGAGAGRGANAPNPPADSGAPTSPDGTTGN